MTGCLEPSSNAGELKEHCEGEDMWLSTGVSYLLDDAGDGLLNVTSDACVFSFVGPSHVLPSSQTGLFPLQMSVSAPAVPSFPL